MKPRLATRESHLKIATGNGRFPIERDAPKTYEWQPWNGKSHSGLHRELMNPRTALSSSDHHHCCLDWIIFVVDRFCWIHLHYRLAKLTEHKNRWRHTQCLLRVIRAPERAMPLAGSQAMPLAGYHFTAPGTAPNINKHHGVEWTQKSLVHGLLKFVDASQWSYSEFDAYRLKFILSDPIRSAGESRDSWRHGRRVYVNWQHSTFCLQRFRH